jgi:hypothetical protein
MKRLLAAAVVALCVPVVALAFDATHHDRLQIAILRPATTESPDATLVQTKVAHYLERELETRGFDAFETEWTFDEAGKAARPVNVDYFVEVAGAAANSNAQGGVAVGGHNGSVTLGMVVSHVGAELRVYEAQTMELIASQTLEKRSTHVQPTSIGVGGADIFGWIALPFFERAQYRSAAKAAAHDAAVLITDAIQ